MSTQTELQTEAELQTELQTESPKALGDRMKTYEQQEFKFVNGNYVLDNTCPFVARIDGHSFSKFTRGACQKPFDQKFCRAMEMTASDLMVEFNARTAYTSSDEISLIFVPIQDETTQEFREWNFNGKVQKLTSLMASYAAIRFNYHFFIKSDEFEQQLNSEIEKGMTRFDILEENYRKMAIERKWMDRVSLLTQICEIQETLLKLKQKLTESKSLTALEKFENGQLAPHFDCRVFNLPNQIEVYNYIFWRSAHDALRNSVHGVAMCHFSTKQLHKKSISEMKEMLLADRKLDYEKIVSDRNKYGIYVKKEEFEHECVVNGNKVVTSRTRPVFFTHQLIGYDAKFSDLLVAKKHLKQI